MMEGDMARHLAFIDRLLADKDKLSAKCVQLGKDVKVMPTLLLSCNLLDTATMHLLCMNKAACKVP